MKTFLLLIIALLSIHAQAVEKLKGTWTVLQAGASIQLRLSGVPADEADQLNSQSFTVAGDGKVALPHIGPIMVAGLTTIEAETAIERTYIAQKVYRFPTITIQRQDPVRDSPQRSQRFDVPGPGYRAHFKHSPVALYP